MGKRWLLAAVTAAATLVMAGAALTGLGSSTGSADDWRRPVDACAQAHPEVGYPLRDCLLASAELALDGGRFWNWAAALDAAAQDSVEVQRMCHWAGHATGRYAAENGLPVDALGTQFPTWGAPDCSSGLVHGLMEGLASPGGVRDVDVALQQCRQIETVDDLAGQNCVHGIGHALWLSSEDFTSSLDWCVTLPGDGLPGSAVENCMNGVLMKLTEGFRLGDDSARVDRAWLRAMEDACAQVGRRAPDLTASCWRNAAAPLGRSASAATFDWVFGDRSGPAWTRVETSWRAAFDGCGAYPARWRGECVSGVLFFVPMAFAAEQDAGDRLCRSLPQGLTGRCLTALKAPPAPGTQLS